jgi:hypothetical protein
MIGYGIGSSLVHEVGHQAAALLGLVASAKAGIDERARRAPPAERPAWELWSRWISEIVADLWSVGKLGIGSTLGLAGVVSLPPFFVFRIATDDPHPAPWIRVVLSCAVGDALYPHAQWRQLASMWEQLYPPTKLPAQQRALLDALRATTGELARLLVEHRPASLRGRSVREIMPVAERRPEQLAALYANWHGEHARMREAAPSLAMAVLGQARADGAIGVEAEARTVGNLLTYWALRSTLDLSEQCVAPEAHRRTTARPPAAREPLLIQGGS